MSAKCQIYSDNTYNVGCYSSCGQIVTDVKADMSGIWKVVITWLGNKVIESFYVKEGNYIALNNNFNENAETLFYLVRPDGTKFIYTHFWEDFAYCEAFNKFKIKTIPTKEIITLCDPCVACQEDTTIDCTII